MQRLARIELRRSTDAPKRPLRAAATPVAPIVKWAGGKSKLIDALRARMPERHRRYFEPFVGGGALFFRTAPGDSVLGDQNADLINAYRCVAWNVEAVIRRLASHRRRHSKDHYYKVRETWNGARKISDVDRAAAFIYLNKTCFNGLWRVNSKGRFNVPLGRYTNPNICDRAKLRAASRLLQRAKLVAGDYQDCVAGSRSGDLVYFDPPYQPLNTTSSFTAYTAGSFGEDDQRELAELARRLHKGGVHVMVSNSDTRLIRRLYRGFDIRKVDCARAINSVASGRGAVSELIITGR